MVMSRSSGLRSRRGNGTLGCLVWLVIFGAVGFYGVKVGELYWRYFELREEMSSAARLAPNLSDDIIRRRIGAKIGELGLEIPLRKIRITRGGNPRTITIETEYTERLTLPLLDRTFVFTPRAHESL